MADTSTAQTGPAAPSIAEVHAALTAPGQMFELEDVVVRGVPVKAWKNAPASLRVLIENSRAHGDLDFLVFDATAAGGPPDPLDRLTFEQHYRAVATLAHRLVDHFGVQKGDRVSIAMRNFPEWSVAFWAAASVGAVVVPLNAWWTGAELEYGLADSGTTILFCDADRARRLEEHLPALGGLRHVVVAKPGTAALSHATDQSLGLPRSHAHGRSA